jgi:hypothetical protein
MKRTSILSLAAIAITGITATFIYSYLQQAPDEQAALPRPVRRFPAGVERLNVPSKLATWPLPGAMQDRPHHGVTHWLARDKDGTTVDFFDFNLKENPALRLEIYDQDEDDAKPWDNRVDYLPRSVVHATRDLNRKFAAQGKGRVIAAWNGLFFGYDRKGGKELAFHVSPVVIGGTVHHWGSNHRWSFGVKYTAGKAAFKTFFLPDRATLQHEYDYGGGSAQCLIKDGKPLKLQPFPTAGSPRLKQPIKSTREEAGHIPYFDHMKSSRASIGWSRDNTYLYLLFVKEPDTESGSILALLRETSPDSAAAKGGWMVSDLQDFWKARRVWGAVNSDAGGVGQLLYAQRDGSYEFVPPQQGTSEMRMTLKGDLGKAPGGGAIMYFYVRDTSG